MSSPRILVVDDDRSYCALVASLLTKRGYIVDVANDGEVALDLVARYPYMLAVIDYQLPGMNGVELFRKAREYRPDLLGIFLTAHANISTVYPAIDAGIERVLSKPLDGREMIPLVERLIGPASAETAS
jgi:DNA-binding response OmpR family regulator